jgi:hypothetical protein
MDELLEKSKTLTATFVFREMLLAGGRGANPFSDLRGIRKKIRELCAALITPIPATEESWSLLLPVIWATR